MTRQRETLLTLLNNMSTAYSMQTTEANSAGNALTRYGAYTKSTAAFVNDFTNSMQKLYNNLINSDVINGAIQLMTGFVSSINNVITEFGGLNTAIFIVIATLAIFKGQAIVTAIQGMIEMQFALGATSVASAVLSGSIKAVSASLIALAANPLTWVIAGLTAVIAVTVSYANYQQQLRKELEDTKNAQENFNKSLIEFNNTLDTSKIDALKNSLESLKEAINYDEAIKKIQDLKAEIKALESREYKSNADRSAIIIKTEELKELEEKIKTVTAAEKEYTEATKTATSIDYKSAQTSLTTIATKIQETQSNINLAKSYESVYNKLVSGQSLTESEVELNNKLLSQYPQYTRVLNDKTKAIGIDYQALLKNTEAQKALAIIEFNSLKENAVARSAETQDIIKQTQMKISAIGVEIEALKARNAVYAASIDSSSADSARQEKLYLNTTKQIEASSKALKAANDQLEMLKTTKDAWDTLSKLDINSIGNTNTTSKTYIPTSSTKNTKETSISDILTQEQKYMNDITEQQNKMNALTSDEYLEKLKVLALVEKEDKDLIAYYESMRSVAKSKGLEDELNEKILKVQGDIASIEKERKDINNEIIAQQEKILEAQKKYLEDQKKANEDILNDTLDSYKDMLDAYVEKQNDLSDETIKKRQEEIDSWKAEEDAISEAADAVDDYNEQLEKQADIQEAQLALTKAQIALQNVLNEKDTRVYHAGIGWVWEANPNNVKVAQDAVEDAKKTLKEKEMAYAEWLRKYNIEQQKKRLEDQIKANEELIKAEEDKQKKLKEKADKAYKELAENAKIAFSNYSNDIAKIMAEIQKNIDAINSELGTNITVGDVTGTVEVKESVKDRMMANSEAWATADAETKKKLEAENEVLGAQMGWYKVNGKWYKPDGTPAYAKGTLSAPETSLAKVGENGEELRVINQGDGILSHEFTKNLYTLGSSSVMNGIMNLLKTPSIPLYALAGATTNNNNNGVTIHNFNMSSSNPQNWYARMQSMVFSTNRQR